MAVAVVHVGTAAKVTFQPTGGSLVTLKNSEWSLKRDPSIAKSSNTTDGIVRAVGMTDASGTVKGDVDTSERCEAQVAIGTIGTLKLYVDATKFFSLVAIIGPFNIETGTEKMETWDFEFMLQSGSVTLPV